MKELSWQHKVPEERGWYWVRYTNKTTSLWYFDGSDWDKNELNKADRFYGPLEPPELPPDD